MTKKAAVHAAFFGLDESLLDESLLQVGHQIT